MTFDLGCAPRFGRPVAGKSAACCSRSNWAAAHFRVVDFSLSAHSGSHITFRRDPELHRQALDDFFCRTGHDFTRFNYLGEWHSHPSFSAHPSGDDIATMTDLVENGEEITFAALMIVRLRFQYWMDCTFTVFARGVAPTTSHVVRVFR